uniref:Serine racemase n=1 Tax=Timema douglasi TaxID=61478 RepID=A0A7R8Z897_TIMDO|nr:unnamed protein product [Timema douglasi]
MEFKALNVLPKTFQYRGSQLSHLLLSLSKGAVYLNKAPELILSLIRLWLNWKVRRHRCQNIYHKAQKRGRWEKRGNNIRDYKGTQDSACRFSFGKARRRSGIFSGGISSLRKSTQLKAFAELAPPPPSQSSLTVYYFPGSVKVRPVVLCRSSTQPSQQANGRSRISNNVQMDLYLKQEFTSFTGSFKERGARNALLCLTPEQRKAGVVAASAGNHAQGLSYHGQSLGIPVKVVMPVIAPLMKIQKCKDFGADVVVEGNDMFGATQVALDDSRSSGRVFINAFDNVRVMAGQGTIGLEILDQLPNVDAVVIPIGGGGLIAGISTAIKARKPDTLIIGVESEMCPSFNEAQIKGKPVLVPTSRSLADGLAVPQVGIHSFSNATNKIDRMVIVKEDSIALAILALVEKEKSVVEGAGAVSMAAILSGQLDLLKGKRVVLVISGGNIDTTVLSRALHKGMAIDGRLLKVGVVVDDRPGCIAELCQVFSELQVNMRHLMHERAWVKADVFSVKVSVICESRSREHSLNLIAALQNKYDHVVLGEFPDPTTL